MRRVAILFVFALVSACGLWLLYPNAKTEFTLDVRDGKGSVFVYSCDDLETEAKTLAQAEEAHAYFQDQIAAMSEEHARNMVEAMFHANETGNLSEIEAVNAKIAKQRRALVNDVDSRFDCRPIGDGTL